VSHPVLVISVGPFGRAVSRHLASLRPDTVETAGEDAGPPATWPLSRITVVAAWRPVPDLCEVADTESHRSGRPFIPLIADSVTLCLGPVVVPGSGGCWSCWARRTRQHAPGLSRRNALWRHYSEHAGSGPQGFLDPFAVVAAVRVSQTVDALDSAQAVAGQAWQIHMITRRITTGTVVGVHDCPRCGLHRSAPTRSYVEMQQALRSRWSGGNGAEP
jgi:bacteriocin biosynthesis cyclodehydratase domain-containing protein